MSHHVVASHHWFHVGAGPATGRRGWSALLRKARRTPFLKKRSRSKVFDGVDVRLLLAFLVSGWGVGARVNRVGGAVKAGPHGGGALTAPVVQLSPATLGLDRSSGGPGLLGTADLTIVQHLERGDRDARRPAIPSRSVRMECSGHSQNGLTQNGRPRHKGGHGVPRARVLAVSELAQAASRPRQRISPSRSPS